MMEWKNIFIKLKTSNVLQLPIHQNRREIVIDSNDGQSDVEVTLICYKIDLIGKTDDVFAYLFQNIDPTSRWYKMKVRNGDRLITLNGQDVTHLSYEHIYTIMIEKKIPFTCQVIWHPELYIEFGELIFI